jgi:hypothetical protein
MAHHSERNEMFKKLLITAAMSACVGTASAASGAEPVAPVNKGKYDGKDMKKPPQAAPTAIHGRVNHAGTGQKLGQAKASTANEPVLEFNAPPVLKPAQ